MNSPNRLNKHLKTFMDLWFINESTTADLMFGAILQIPSPCIADPSRVILAL